MSGRKGRGPSVLSPEQDKLLGLFARSPLSKQFYFGGASALSAVYFQHRTSQDLDFFCPEEFTPRRLASFEAALKRLKFKFSRDRRLPVYIYHVTAPGGATTRVDFSYFPYDRIDRGTRWRGIDVDSILDMAVNKIHAIASRFEDKDLVDLYFLLTLRPKLDLMDLIKKVPLKFDARVTPMTLAEKLMRAEEIKLMPTLIHPVRISVIREFLVDQARRIVKEERP